MLVTIDGPDGTGKTTVARALLAALERRGLPCFYTAEPTDSPTGVQIRKLLRSGGTTPAQMTELFVRDRAEHVRDVLIPRSAAGEIVVCDRYKYSTVCYQHLQGEPLDRLLSLNAPFPAPDLAVILTAPNTGMLLERIARRGGARDLFETRAIQERAAVLYGQMERFYPGERFLMRDAALPVETTVSAIMSCIISLKP